MSANKVVILAVVTVLLIAVVGALSAAGIDNPVQQLIGDGITLMRSTM